MPSITTLSKRDLRRFITFCAEDRSTGDFDVYLGLSRNEVTSLKASLGIDSPAAARSLIQDVVLLEQKEEELRLAERQAIAKREQLAAQERMDAAADRRRAERAEKRRKVLSVTKVKLQDKKRQQKFDKQQEKAKPIKADGWRLPDVVPPDQFARDIRVRGIRFTCDRYNASRSDIMSEAARLKLKIDFDLVPR
jgi:hypothetical protein